MWKPLRWLTWFIAADDPRLINGVPRSRYVEQGVLHSEAKISVFYKTIMVLFLAMSVISHFATTASPGT